MKSLECCMLAGSENYEVEHGLKLKFNKASKFECVEIIIFDLDFLY